MGQTFSTPLEARVTTSNSATPTRANFASSSTARSDASDFHKQESQRGRRVSLFCYTRGTSQGESRLHPGSQLDNSLARAHGSAPLLCFASASTPARLLRSGLDTLREALADATPGSLLQSGPGMQPNNVKSPAATTVDGPVRRIDGHAASGHAQLQPVAVPEDASRAGDRAARLPGSTCTCGGTRQHPGSYSSQRLE